jgi:hypothetical protein
MPSVFTLEGAGLGCGDRRPDGPNGERAMGFADGLVIGGPTAFAVMFLLAGIAAGGAAYTAHRVISPRRRRSGPRGSRWSY